MHSFSHLKPLLGGLRNRIRPTEDCQIDVLNAEEIQTVQPPSILPESLERLTEAANNYTLARVLHDLRATTLTHAPCLRFSTQNALVAHYGIATSRRLHQGGKGFVSRALRGKIHDVPEVRHVSTPVAEKYFGHWVHDSCVTAQIDPELPLIMPQQPGWQHCAGYLDLLGLNPLDDYLYLAEKVTWYQDYSLCAHRRARARAVRDKIRTRCSPGNGHGKVFFRRGTSGESRTLSNEERLLEQLSRLGWRIVDFNKLSVREIEQELLDAEIVASVDGSHVAHVLHAVAEGTALIICTPHDRADTMLQRLAHANRLRVGFCVMSGSKQAGYHLDLEELAQIADLTQEQPLPPA